MRLRRAKLRRGRLRLVKRCGRLSGGRSRARVAASAADASVGEEIEVDGIAVGVIVADVSLVARADETKVRVRLAVVRLVARAAGIRGWIRCGSGSLRVVLGRVLRMTRLWI
jgi:hypothetical protein